MGDRPAEVAGAIASGRAQGDGSLEVVLVVNGGPALVAPDGVKVVALPANLGVGGGRNAGVAAAAGDVIMFLDDDGWYPDTGLARYVAYRFAEDPGLAVISFRVVDPAGGPGARWHVPRLRAGDPERSSEVTTFAGGACAIRLTSYMAAGGLPEEFFYAHEETDLAWRLLGLGFRLEYDAAARTCHHALPNARHAAFYRLDGRNRVLLARRNLPWPLATLYLLTWVALTVVRERSLTAVRASVSGVAGGWRVNPGLRRPSSGRTAWRHA